MIERYECTEISQIWNNQTKFKTYLEVEMALLQALEEASVIPAGTREHYQNIEIRPKRIAEIEAITRHDVIAFCTSITEQVNDHAKKYFHFGCTSSDIIDTATNLQVKRSLEVIIPMAKQLQASLKRRADEMKHIPCMGRSHGMNAEPLSFGQKFLSFYAEVSRRIMELEDYLAHEFTAQFSGAVGSYTILSPQIEERAAGLLGLKTETVSTQVIPRDRIAKLISIHALLASALERLAIEIRHLHHSDIGELHEGFSKGQKGSSTMPHKKNPISGENITGMARILRSHVSVALDNIGLWHERDISHSSAERLMLPDNLGLMYYALKRMSNTVDNLVFHKEVITEKIHHTFNYLSSYVLHKIITQVDMGREDIYAKVQKAAFEAKDANRFLAMVQGEFSQVDLSDIDKLDDTTIKKIYLAHTDAVWSRVESSY